MEAREAPECAYDRPEFFEKYSQMSRSKYGLSGAGEWPTLKEMLPDFAGKRLLDLGCGYGWHCVYAMEHGAQSALGLDLSGKMLQVAREKTPFPQVEYRQGDMEQAEFEAGGFDVVLSSLALHYIADYDALVRKVHRWLSPGGRFIFTCEHPVFTAQGTQDRHQVNRQRLFISCLSHQQPALRSHFFRYLPGKQLCRPGRIHTGLQQRACRFRLLLQIHFFYILHLPEQKEAACEYQT